MGIIQKALEVLKEPRAFFRHLNEKGVGSAWVYFAVLSLIASALGFVVRQLTATTSANMMARLFNLPASSVAAAASMGFGWAASMALIGYVFGLAFVFVIMAVLFVWIYIFGGRAGYEKTFQLGVYAYTPSFLLGWIPFVGFLGGIWSLILLIIGTQEVHDLSRVKSILMYVIPAVIIGFFMLASFVLLAVMLRGVPGMYAA
jgi:hypothetical protein